MNAIERFKSRKNFSPEVSFEYPPADLRNEGADFLSVTLTRLSPVEDREFRQRCGEVLTKQQYDADWAAFVERLVDNHFKACATAGAAWTQATFKEFIQALHFGELTNLAAVWMVTLSADENRAATSPL